MPHNLSLMFLTISNIDLEFHQSQPHPPYQPMFPILNIPLMLIPLVFQCHCVWISIVLNIVVIPIYQSIQVVDSFIDFFIG